MLISNVKIDKIIKSRRSSIAIEINSHGEVILRVPNHVKASFIEKIVLEKRDWILKKQNLLKTKVLNKKEFIFGETFYYLGCEYALLPSFDSKKSLDFDSAFYVNELYLTNVHKLLADWYKKQAKKYLPTRAMELGKASALTITNISINSAKKRWGSCSASGSINFSWRLIMLPPEVIDYVIVHELAHLKELNHSKKFWDFVEVILPDYKVPKQWLKNNSVKFHYI